MQVFMKLFIVVLATYYKAKLFIQFYDMNMALYDSAVSYHFDSGSNSHQL